MPYNWELCDVHRGIWRVVVMECERLSALASFCVLAQSLVCLETYFQRTAFNMLEGGRQISHEAVTRVPPSR